MNPSPSRVSVSNTLSQDSRVAERCLFNVAVFVVQWSGGLVWTLLALGDADVPAVYLAVVFFSNIGGLMNALAYGRIIIKLRKKVLTERTFGTLPKDIRTTRLSSA